MGAPRLSREQAGPLRPGSTTGDSTQTSRPDDSDIGWKREPPNRWFAGDLAANRRVLRSAPVRLDPRQARVLASVLLAYAESHPDTEETDVTRTYHSKPFDQSTPLGPGRRKPTTGATIRERLGADAAELYLRLTGQAVTCTCHATGRNAVPIDCPTHGGQP